MATRRHTRRPNDRTVTLDEGRRALVVAARLVDLYGEIYLPLFERLERELVALSQREDAIERARLIARTGWPITAQKGSAVIMSSGSRRQGSRDA